MKFLITLLSPLLLGVLFTLPPAHAAAAAAASGDNPGVVATQQASDPAPQAEASSPAPSAEASGPAPQAEATGRPQPEPDPLAAADALYKAGKYNEAIQRLTPLAANEPFNLRINILLAKAQIEEAAAMKAQGNAQYKILIHQPYRNGARLYRIDPTSPGPIYVIGKSLLVNDRPHKGVKALKKALYYAPNDVEILLAYAEGCLQLSEKNDLDQAIRLMEIARDSCRRAIELKKGDEGFEAATRKIIDKISKRMRYRKKHDSGNSMYE